MIEVLCNICGADDWQVRFPATMTPDAHLEVDAIRCTSPEYGQHAQIVTCQRCGHIYANPRWESHELLQTYAAVEDETYVQERVGRELTFERHLQKLESITGPAGNRTLLDVGAYIGVFVEVASRAGWQALGVEPSTWAVEVARQRELCVLEGTQEHPELDGRQFDVVTMWDVIEHVADPKRELQLAYERLKPGGVLAVHTMNVDSLFARLMGPRWPWLMSMHIHYFSRASLAGLLRACGYEILFNGIQGRYLSLGYLASRVEALSKPVGGVIRPVVNTLGLANLPIPINTFDLFTIFARKPRN